MSGDSAVVLDNGAETIVVMRGAGSAGDRILKRASAATLRAALRSYQLAGRSFAPLDALWSDAARSCPAGSSSPDRVIERVTAAVDAGVLKAWVLNETAQTCRVDPDGLKINAIAMVRERQAKATAPAPMRFDRTGMPITAPDHRSIADMDISERFYEAVIRGSKLVAPEMRRQLEIIFRDPAALGMMIGVFAAMMALHTVAVGQAIDAIALTALIASAMLRGYSLFMAVRSALEAVEHFVKFLLGVSAARTEADLDKAAREFASMVAAVGVSVLMAAINRIASKVQRSASSRTGGGRQNVSDPRGG